MIIKSLEHCPIRPTLEGSIPSQGTCQSGSVQEAANQCFSLVSMFSSLSLPVSLKSIKHILGEDKKIVRILTENIKQ